LNNNLINLNGILRTAKVQSQPRNLIEILNAKDQSQLIETTLQKPNQHFARMFGKIPLKISALHRGESIFLQRQGILPNVHVPNYFSFPNNI